MSLSISKKLFIETINEINKQMKHDIKCGEAFNVILPHDYTSLYDNHWLLNQIIKLLKIATYDDHEDSWIDYYIWELNFGKNWKKNMITYDNKNVDLKTPTDLWNILNNK